MTASWCPGRDAKTHVLTHGLHYGSCVFEGERIYGGTIYKLKEHTARLFKSAEILGMKIPFTQDEINAACIEAAEAQGIKDGYVRPVAFRGSEMMAVSAQNTKIHVAIAVWQWPSYFDPGGKAQGHPPGHLPTGGVPRPTPRRPRPKPRAST